MRAPVAVAAKISCSLLTAGMSCAPTGALVDHAAQCRAETRPTPATNKRNKANQHAPNAQQQPANKQRATSIGSAVFLARNQSQRTARRGAAFDKLRLSAVVAVLRTSARRDAARREHDARAEPHARREHLCARSESVLALGQHPSIKEERSQTTEKQHPNLEILKS